MENEIELEQYRGLCYKFKQDLPGHLMSSLVVEESVGLAKYKFWIPRKGLLRPAFWMFNYSIYAQVSKILLRL